MYTVYMKFVKIAGWYGLIALLAAFMFATLGAIPYGGWAYVILNITGAAGIAANALARKDYPAGVLNLVWIAIGLVGLAKLLH